MKWDSNPNLNLSKENYDKAKEMQKNFFEFEYDGDSRNISPNKLYQLAMVIGIKNNEWVELSSPKEYLTTGNNIDTEFFKNLLEVIHPNLTEDERVERAMKYAEYGIIQMYESYDETGMVEYNELINGVGEGEIRQITQNFIGQTP